jgi:hypothetical protein
MGSGGNVAPLRETSRQIQAPPLTKRFLYPLCRGFRGFAWTLDSGKGEQLTVLLKGYKN